jgi:hypothetical protein
VRRYERNASDGNECDYTRASDTEVKTRTTDKRGTGRKTMSKARVTDDGVRGTNEEMVGF